MASTAQHTVREVLREAAPLSVDELVTRVTARQPLTGKKGQAGRGAGSGGDYTYAHGTLDITLDLATDAAHYTGQLERAGWQPREAGQSIALA